MSIHFSIWPYWVKRLRFSEHVEANVIIRRMVQCKWSRLFQSTFETKDHWEGNENEASRETHFLFSRYSAVEKLVEKYGSTLNVAKDDGFTTLHIAAINGYREIAEILLEQVIRTACNFSICLSQRILKQFTTLQGNSRSCPFLVYLLFCYAFLFILFTKPLRLIEREMPKTNVKCSFHWFTLTILRFLLARLLCQCSGNWKSDSSSFGRWGRVPRYGGGPFRSWCPC